MKGVKKARVIRGIGSKEAICELLEPRRGGEEEGQIIYSRKQWLDHPKSGERSRYSKFMTLTKFTTQTPLQEALSTHLRTELEKHTQRESSRQQEKSLHLTRNPLRPPISGPEGARRHGSRPRETKCP